MSLLLDGNRWRWQFTLTEKLQVRKGCSTPGWSDITGQYSYHIPKSCRREGLFSFSWIFSSGGGASLPAEILAGQRRGRAPMSYDSFYPTFRLPTQARNGLGHELRRCYCAAMSRL